VETGGGTCVSTRATVSGGSAPLNGF
jgi:hypothetical protein